MEGGGSGGIGEWRSGGSGGGRVVEWKNRA